MTRTRYRIIETETPYFMTCTIVGWLAVFTRSEAVEIILDSWRHLQRERDFRLFGYAILENHLHLVAASSRLPKDIQNFKSYTARQIVDLLSRKSEKTLLSQLSYQKLRHKTGSDYQVWQEGSHPKQIRDSQMMRQKIEYMHYNPVKRGYVDDPIHWRYSSARNYAGNEGLIEVVSDWDWE